MALPAGSGGIEIAANEENFRFPNRTGFLAGCRQPSGFLQVGAINRDRTALGIRELALYDVDGRRVGLIAALGREVVRRYDGEMTITTPAT